MGRGFGSRPKKDNGPPFRSAGHFQIFISRFFTIYEISLLIKELSKEMN
jgi:hypothetical protein